MYKKFYLSGSQNVFQGTGNQPVIIGIHSDIIRFIGGEGLKRTQVCGRLDSHPVAFGDQDFSDGIQHSLRPAGGGPKF